MEMSENHIQERTEKMYQELVEESKHEQIFQEAQTPKNSSSHEGEVEIIENQHEQSANYLKNNQAQQQKQMSNQRATSQPAPKVINIEEKMVGDIVRGSSKIQYIPFERKVVQYRNEQRIERIPKKKIVTEYREEKVIENIPREVVKQDYYAIEHIRKYIPQQVEQKERVLVPRQKIVKKIQYVPVQRQIVHGKPEENQFSNQILGNTYGFMKQNIFSNSGINYSSFDIPSNNYVSNYHAYGNTSSIKQSRSRKSRINRKHSDLYESYVSETNA